MSYLSLTNNEHAFLSFNLGELDYKRNVIIMPDSKWQNIQKELTDLENKKKDNEVEFNLREQDFNTRIFSLNGQTQNEEKQLTEKLTKIQNEILSYQLKIKANNLEALERKAQQNEQKIQNEMNNKHYFEGQKAIFNNNDKKLCQEINALKEQEMNYKKKLEMIELEIEKHQLIEKNNVEEMIVESQKFQNENEKKQKDYEETIIKYACLICKINKATILMEKCCHLCYCSECLRIKKNTSEIRNNSDNEQERKKEKIECPVCFQTSSTFRAVLIP